MNHCSRILPCLLLFVFSLARIARADPPPTLEVESLGDPVKAARRWTMGLASHPDGPRLILQYYNYVYGREDMEAPPEWLIVDLNSNSQKRFHHPGYANSNYGIANQLEAPNGRIFFSALGNRIHYYEPATDTIETLGQILPSGSGYTFFYRLTIGPDGHLYATTQASHGRCALAVINTETLEVQRFTDLGGVQREEGLTYGYYHAADPPWVYVAIGKGRWTLVAINIETGEQRVLLDHHTWMSFGRHDGNVRVQAKQDLAEGQEATEAPNRLISGKAFNDYWWCIEGKLYADNSKSADELPERAQPPATAFTEHMRRKIPREAVMVEAPARDGTVKITWDAAALAAAAAKPGAPGASAEAQAQEAAPRDLREATAHVESLAPILLESLIALPDGSLLGNAKQYEGFYRYWPAGAGEGRLTHFGRHGPSRPEFALQGGLVYFAGYPTSGLYVYDPARPWQPADKATPTDPQANPHRIMYLGTEDLSGAHYAVHLTAGPNGRIYMMGRLERGHNGTGLAWYDPATGKADGHHRDLGTLQPRGFALLESLDRIVISGLLRSDPYTPGPMPEQAELVVYDLDLQEQKRLIVKPGLHSTGHLYPLGSAAPTTVLGVIGDPSERRGNAGYAMYLYDVAAEKLVAWRDLDVRLGAVFQSPQSGSWYATDAQQTLLVLNPQTLETTPVGKLSRPIGEIQVVGDMLYGTHETELVRVALP